MNDTKVVLYMCPDDLPRIVGDNGIGVPVYGGTFGRYTLPLVTHTDYMALEEHRASVEFLLKLEREAHEATKEELAALRVRVGELCAGVDEFYACDIYIEGPEGADTRLIDARKAFP